MKNLFYGLCLVALSVIIWSCSKDSEYGTGGGNLPSVYIHMYDSSFTPNNVSTVYGNNIVFINHTNTNKTLRTADSTTINVTVEANKFYRFKKDTTGSFTYWTTDHPTVTGVFVLTP